MNTIPITYNTKALKIPLNVYYYENNFWLTLNSIAELFNTSTQKIYIMLKEIAKTTKTNSFNKHIEVTLKNGSRSTGNFFSLDIIIAIGYRLNPKKAMEFHHWSMKALKNQIHQRARVESSFMRSLKRAIAF